MALQHPGSLGMIAMIHGSAASRIGVPCCFVCGNPHLIPSISCMAVGVGIDILASTGVPSPTHDITSYSLSLLHLNPAARCGRMAPADDGTARTGTGQCDH